MLSPSVEKRFEEYLQRNRAMMAEIPAKTLVGNKCGTGKKQKDPDRLPYAVKNLQRTVEQTQRRRKTKLPVHSYSLDPQAVQEKYDSLAHWEQLQKRKKEQDDMDTVR